MSSSIGSTELYEIVMIFKELECLLGEHEMKELFKMLMDEKNEMT